MLRENDSMKVDKKAKGMVKRRPKECDDEPNGIREWGFGMGRRSATIKGPMPLFWQARKIKEENCGTGKV